MYIFWNAFDLEMVKAVLAVPRQYRTEYQESLCGCLKDKVPLDGSHNPALWVARLRAHYRSCFKYWRECETYPIRIYLNRGRSPTQEV